MIEVSIPEMMEAGAHFGHQTKRWNPKMRQYIYGSRSGVHILDLQKTKDLANDALTFLTRAVAEGKNILFVGTKQQAREIMKSQAIRAKMHFVNQRWMGGTMTNFKTIKKSIDRLIEMTTKRANNEYTGYTKKELLDIDRMVVKLDASLGGIKGLTRTPDVVFIVDPKHEHIAILEARKLGVPIVAITDSNCDPTPIDYVIPANDDALATIEYFATKIADACLLGLEQRELNARNDKSESDGDRQERQHKRRVTKAEPDNRDKKGGSKKAYVAKSAETKFEGEAAEGYSAKVEATATEDVVAGDAALAARAAG